jgi:predicted RNA-binding Zn ribbon-like protein
VQPAAPPDTHWRLIGGRPCLDFVNTVGGRVSSPRPPRARAAFADHVTRDDLPDYASLLRWSAFASLLEPPEVDRLREQARRSAPAARRVLRRALRLREAVYRIGRALVEGRPPPEADLRILDREVHEARKRQRLVARRHRLQAEWMPDTARLDRVLWPLALSAESVFGSDDADRLRQCGGTACGWLFLDSTRNHSRHWCDMADCGNRAKVRRFRARVRKDGRRSGG